MTPQKSKKKAAKKWLCKFCGQDMDKDSWFDRSITIDGIGREVEGNGFVCGRCGRKEQ